MEKKLNLQLCIISIWGKHTQKPNLRCKSRVSKSILVHYAGQYGTSSCEP